MKNAHWSVIANPKSGGGKVQKNISDIEIALKAYGLDYQLFFTEKKGHATSLAIEAIEKGCRHIFGIGGDGTNSEIADGILQQKSCPSTDVVYSLLPLGRGNDWARGYGISPKIEDFFKRLEKGETKWQDVGIVYFKKGNEEKSRHFINVAGMAYDGYLVKTSEESAGGLRGGLHYQWMILRCLASYKAPSGKVLFDGKTVKSKFYLINIGLCRYSGGGMQLVPHAVPVDGIFALTIAGNVPKWDVILQTPRFYNGKIGDYRHVQLHEAKSISVEQEGDLPIYLEVDGEYIGTTPARFELLEKAFTILV